MRLPNPHLPKPFAAALMCVLMLALVPTQAAARTHVTVRRAPARIHIHPGQNLLAWHRRCTDWYALEHRVSGTVLTPHMRCWWTRR